MENKNNSHNFFDHDTKRNPRIEYKTTPCKALQIPIQEYMLVECNQGIELETLPSTSLSLDIIIKGKISMHQQDGSIRDLPKAVIFGIARRSFKFTFAEKTLLFVVIFNPGYAASLIKKPLNLLFEKFIALEELFDTQKVSNLVDTIKNKKSYEQMVEIIEQFLLEEIEPCLTDNIINESIVKIKNRNGIISVKELTSGLPISRDAFEKRFRAKVGTTPKQYINIIRFRNLFLSNYAKDNLTEIALKAGYYDQSHFIKDFKASTGRLPSKFL